MSMRGSRVDTATARPLSPAALSHAPGRLATTRVGVRRHPSTTRHPPPLAKRENRPRDEPAPSPGSETKIPTFERFGIRVRSAGLNVGEDEPLADASMVSTMVAHLMFQTGWGTIDHLVVDFPPGTGGVQQTLIGAVRYAGAILVVT